MSNNIQKLSIQKISYPLDQAEIMIDDVFINNISLQKTLKKKHSALFAQGRFKEFFILYLGRTFSDIYHSKKEYLNSALPHEGETHITPLYGCADSCCVYLYVKVRRSGTHIYWEAIGRNTAFVHPSHKEENAVDWLPSFEPLVFDFKTYHSFLKNKS